MGVDNDMRMALAKDPSSHGTDRNKFLYEFPNLIVVTYCTLGYRSGLQAVRLKRQYPNLNVYSLDGIVPFTHVLADMDQQEQEQRSEMEPHETQDSTGTTIHEGSFSLALVDPSTGQPTNRVHTFGPMWNFSHLSYQAQWFSPVTLLMRVAQVAAQQAVVGCGGATQFCGGCYGSCTSRCCDKKPSPQLPPHLSLCLRQKSSLLLDRGDKDNERSADELEVGLKHA